MHREHRKYYSSSKIKDTNNGHTFRNNNNKPRALNIYTNELPVFRYIQAKLLKGDKKQTPIDH